MGNPEPLGLPFSQLAQVIFTDHVALVGWKPCLHGLVMQFEGFCITHNELKYFDSMGECLDSLALREWCPACHSLILAQRTVQMEKQMEANS
jgi:hypothetical protein